MNYIFAFQLSRTDHWNERLLIESRLQISLSDSDFVCAYHHFSMGIGWKQPNKCQHSEHKFQVGRKAPKIRTIPLKTLETFNKENSPLPIGSAFCFRHLKCITAKDDDEADPEPTTPIKSSTPADDNYVPDTAIISNETLEEVTNTANSLCNALVTSPLSFQIKQKRIEHLTESTKLKVKKKFERVK